MSWYRISASVVALAVLMAGVMATAPTGPDLELLGQRNDVGTVKTADDDNDWARIYIVDVRNKGAAGKVRAKAKAFGPQGQFYKEVEETFAADERKSIRFVFPEFEFISELFNAEKSVRFEFSYDVIR